MKGAGTDDLQQRWVLVLLLCAAAAVIALMAWRFLAFGEFVYGDIPHVSSKSLGVWIEDLVYVWHSKGGGTLFPQPLGKIAYLPVFLLSFLQPWLFKLLWYVMPILLGLPAMFLLLRRLGIDRNAAIIASVFYIVNPVTIVWFNLGQASGLLPLAPLCVYFIVRWGERGEISWLLCATLALAGMLMFYPSILLPATLMFGIMCLANLPPIRKPMIAGSLAISAVVLGLVLSSYFFQASIGGSSTYANYTSDFKWNYKKMDATHAPLLAGNQGSSQETFGVNKFTLTLLPAILLLIFLAFSVLYTDGRGHLLAVAIFAGCALTLYVMASNLGLVTKLAEHFSVLGTLRNPIKLQFILMVAFTVAFAYALLLVPKGRTLGGVLLVLYLTFFMTFAFDGLMGFTARTPDVQKFKANPTLLTINDWLTEQTDWTSMTIILPYTHQVELHIGETHHNAYPVKFDGSDKRVVALYRSIEAHKDDERYLSNALARLGVRYVIVQNLTEKQFPLFLGKETPQNLTRRLRSDPAFTTRYEGDGFTIFEHTAQPKKIAVSVDGVLYDGQAEFDEELVASPGKVLIPVGALVPPAQVQDPSVTMVARRESPARYTVEYESDAPFYLVLREAYHDKWTVEPSGAAAAHFVADGYANGWLINQTGKGTLELEFTPQRTYARVLAVSLFAIAGTLVAIGLLRRRGL